MTTFGIANIHMSAANPTIDIGTIAEKQDKIQAGSGFECGCCPKVRFPEATASQLWAGLSKSAFRSGITRPSLQAKSIFPVAEYGYTAEALTGHSEHEKSMFRHLAGPIYWQGRLGVQTNRVLFSGKIL